MRQLKRVGGIWIWLECDRESRMISRSCGWRKRQVFLFLFCVVIVVVVVVV